MIPDVRRELRRRLQQKIAGPAGAATAERVWLSEGPRWFTEDDPIWRVHADASMFVGGVRALLLQSLHPLAMYGVAEHSGYRDDPWARVASTAAYIAMTTYGTVDDAEELIGKVRRIHDRVNGTAPDGRAYSAHDPQLLLWVHVAEVDSFLAAYQAYGRRPLTPAEADTYVEQAGLAATKLGVVDPPTSVAGLKTTIDAFRPDLAVTPPARDAIRLVLKEPPMAWYGRPVYEVVAQSALATLQPWARTMIGARVAPKRVVSPVGKATLGTVAWVMGAPRDRHVDLESSAS